MSETDDTKTVRVAYLRYLRDEFRHYWPYGSVRSSEPSERQSFEKAKKLIVDLEAKIREGPAL